MSISVQFRTNSVNLSEFMPLKKKDIAQAVGWSTSMLSRGRFKKMPAFETIQEFKAWEVSTRQRGTSQFSHEISVPAKTEKISDRQSNSSGLLALVDWDEINTTSENHLDVTLARCMSISNITYGLVQAAAESGDVAAMFGATKNWSAALKEEAEVRSKLLQQQIEERSVIHLDEVKHVVGLIVQELVSEIETMLSRGAVKANPEDPARALESYKSEFDLLKMRVQGSLNRIENELCSDEVEEGVELCVN